MSDPCICHSAPKLNFSRAGAADVGEIAGRAARKLHKEGAGKLFCLARFLRITDCGLEKG